jgi:hypothetical protein
MLDLKTCLCDRQWSFLAAGCAEISNYKEARLLFREKLRLDRIIIYIIFRMKSLVIALVALLCVVNAKSYTKHACFVKNEDFRKSERYDRISSKKMLNII